MDGEKLREAAAAGDLALVKSILKEQKSKLVDAADEDGMTPLMHAAYKNQLAVCDYLLSKGADVNWDNHTHQYTPLMFAVLSGSPEVTQLLLQSGASLAKTNGIGKTAAQLAGFVGNHNCVTVISNFFPQTELEPYTKPQGLSSTPKLYPDQVPAFYELVTSSNLNPIKLTMHLTKHGELLRRREDTVYVLEHLLETRANELNEPLAMKLHYLIHIVDACVAHENGSQGFMKHLLTGRESDGALLNMEKFVRLSIRDFKYRNSQLLLALVKNITAVTPGDQPSALSFLEQSINGLQSSSTAESCFACGAKGNQKLCSACKKVSYCSPKCQQLHWFSHKKQCKK